MGGGSGGRRKAKDVSCVRVEEGRGGRHGL